MNTDYAHIAKKVINTEAEALLNLVDKIDTEFNKAIKLLLTVKGKVIVTGIGKSGHIGRKIAASFASTGTSSFFLHPSEAIHGDLGMVSKNDLVLAITNSGETSEIVKLIPYLTENKIPLISISSRPTSTLAIKSTVHLNLGTFKEACPLHLAPTTSSTLSLAIGDALMVALMQGKGFNEAHFAKFHPGGNLGKQLLDTVNDLMLTQNLPLVETSSSVKDVIYTINSGRCGLCIVGTKTKILGIITDGDLRRAMNKNENSFFTLTAKEIMTNKPKFISKKTKLIDAKHFMNSHKITSLLVGTNSNLEGIIQLHDINL